MNKLFGLVLISLLFSANVLAEVEQVTTDDFSTVEKKAIAMGEKFGIENVLLVFDMDNTLLAMKQDLGSDQWFTWQSDGQKDSHKAMPGQLVAKDVGGLLDAWGMLISLSKMRPTQENAPELLNNLQAQGFRTIVLTARSPEIRDTTERALASNGYFFSKTIGPDKGYPSTYLPYDLGDMEDTSGMSSDEAKSLGLVAARPVSFQNGIFMGSGQHKGAMLRALLKKVDLSPKAILFSDDHEKHTINMAKAFSTTEAVKKKFQVTTFRYSREDLAVKKFHSGSKVKVTQQWKRLKSVLDQTFSK